MILADTSAWIEYLRGTGSFADGELTRLLEADEQLATTGLVLLELLAGARDEREAADLRRLIDRCQFVSLEEPSDLEAAATLYRIARREGTTVRRLPDCLIAAVAMRVGATLLHRDSDFEAIARIAPLETLSGPG